MQISSALSENPNLPSVSSFQRMMDDAYTPRTFFLPPPSSSEIRFQKERLGRYQRKTEERTEEKTEEWNSIFWMFEILLKHSKKKKKNGVLENLY